MATCNPKNYMKGPHEDVVQKLHELFGDTLNLEIIKSVASSCRYDVQESSNKLLEITEVRDQSSVHSPYSKILQIPSNVQKNVESYIPKINKSKKTLDIERVIKDVQEGYKVLILLRGLPGSGKSHLAKRIIKETVGTSTNVNHIFSADDYFLKNGHYRFEASKISDAHDSNQRKAFQAMCKGISPVIIDNTNTELWEMKPYASMAIDYGYLIEILEPDNNWSFNDRELSFKNVHGVDKGKIKQMHDRYEKNVTPAKLLSAYNLQYRLQQPPQLRKFPPLENSKKIGAVLTNGNDDKNHFPVPNTFANVRRKIAPPNNFGYKHSNQLSKPIDFSAFLPNKSFKQNFSGPIETINLMDFSEESENPRDDKVSPTSFSHEFTPTWHSASFENSNTVDGILMCSNQSNSNILQPVQFSNSASDDTMIIESSSDSSDANSNGKESKFLNNDIEHAWGINEKALQSWDIVTPIDDNDPAVNTQSENKQGFKESIEKTDSFCNTNEEDFRMLQYGDINQDNMSVLFAKSRDINLHTPESFLGIPKKIMVDKSCLTETISEKDTKNDVSQLISMFPKIPRKYLSDFYHKCNKDLDWTIELLLEDTNLISLGTMDLNESSDEENDHVLEDTVISQQQPSASEENQVKQNKIQKRKIQTEESMELKKWIEKKINISDDYYSGHLLHVRQSKYGQINQDPKPTTSKSEKCLTDVGEILMVDSDIEFDESDDNDSCDKNDENAVQMIELNLGETFVSQLESNFGDPSIAYPKGFQPVVQVPIILARQLYTFYIESVFQQMEAQNQVLDTLIKEDEEFAKKLQAQDETNIRNMEETPNLKEIMEEEAVYRKDVEQGKNMTPDTLAMMLTKQKLFKCFPKVDQNALLELLAVNENSYKQTVDTLKLSLGLHNLPEYANTPPIDECTIKEMEEAHNACKQTDVDERHEPMYYREAANKHLNIRTDLYQKAQKYYQKGMTEVAQFYSTLAQKQTNLYDKANNLAASTFLDEHAKRLEKFDTLDLHFLYVKEAIPALDVFLDRNINLLTGSSSKTSQHLNIITGRGRRSENGTPKIKPAVIARLKKRKIKFCELNPGLLKIKVTRNSPMTSDLP